MSGIISPMVVSYESYATSPTQSISLYQRLGGKPASQAVVDNFVWRGKADSRIKRGECLASTPAWPCNLRMRITKAEFNALVGDLFTILNRLKVVSVRNPSSYLC